MDLASFLCSLMIDESDLQDIKYNEKGQLTEQYVKELIKGYALQAKSVEIQEETNLDQSLHDNMKSLMLLNNYLGAVWALQAFEESDFTKGKEEVFNWKLAQARVDLNKHLAKY
ncbi:hypothetical protein FGO68_gene8090 [Halteria grandinella]|uniref:Uncharacterized protein n=1 Tax=Halteria grandinella TaxID=5974 RepID=A0A8J8NBB3_HALGN|nr:hypothetical protein FGO68_gene8090 [Halteria grandinella]